MNLDTYDLANRYSYIATRFEDFGRAVREYSNLVNDIAREDESMRSYDTVFTTENVNDVFDYVMKYQGGATN